jgi:hypothetical protein
MLVSHAHIRRSEPIHRSPFLLGQLLSRLNEWQHSRHVISLFGLRAVFPSPSYAGFYTHHSLLLGLAGNDGHLLGQVLDEGQELGLAGDVLPQHLGDDEALLGLVVLEDAAQSALGGGEGLAGSAGYSGQHTRGDTYGVQGVDVFLASAAGGLSRVSGGRKKHGLWMAYLLGLLDAVADLELTGLEVGACGCQRG